MMPFPPRFLHAMERQLEGEAPDFLRALEDAPERALRINPWKAGEALYPDFAPVPWEPLGRYVPSDFRPGMDIAHFAGAYYMQDASAMAVAAVLHARPGERVLDLCAAPGGKAGQIAAALNGRGVLIANEPDAKRAKVLSGNLERMGVANAAVVSALPERLAARWQGLFDAVLVDAPCSGEGMFRRDEGARAEWSPEAVEGCAARQRGILRSAASLVRPGGRLIYSTCTFNEQENEENIRHFLDECRDFAPEDFVLTGVGASKEGVIRLWPHRVRGEGHCIARLRRGGEGMISSPALHAQSLEGDDGWRELLGEWPARYAAYRPVREGDIVHFIPPDMPPMDGIKVLRHGLHAYRIGRGYIEPDHALARAIHPREAARVARLNRDQARDYLAGEQIDWVGEKGWTLAVYRELPLGWGKVSGDGMKNHLPKGLRVRIP